MEVVGGFIGFNADEGRFDFVNSTVESILADISQVLREEHLQGGIEEGPEFLAPTD